MTEGFMLLDRNFITLQINAEGLRLEGRPASEIVGRSHWDAYPGSEYLPVGQLYKRVMRERVLRERRSGRGNSARTQRARHPHKVHSGPAVQQELAQHAVHSTRKIQSRQIRSSW